MLTLKSHKKLFLYSFSKVINFERCPGLPFFKQLNFTGHQSLDPGNKMVNQVLTSIEMTKGWRKLRILINKGAHKVLQLLNRGVLKAMTLVLRIQMERMKFLV